MKRVTTAGLCMLVVGFPIGLSARSSDLTIDERATLQTRIEQVYWNHTLWPEQNPTPKPALRDVLPEAAIRAKVEDVLLKSTALERYWRRPVLAEQLQAEMERMAAATRRPDLLKELFAALDNDPTLIAECLARPILVDRLIRSWYAQDERFHAEQRATAVAALASLQGVAGMRFLGAEYEEMEVVEAGHAIEQPHDTSGAGRVELETGAWRSLLARLASSFADGDRFREVDPADLLDHIPVGRVTPLIEDDDAFAAYAVVEKTGAGIRLATVRWPKKSFDAWWSEARLAFSHELGLGESGAATEPGFSGYELPSITASGCTEDTWAATKVGVPDPRANHVAVWTGTEMIVWGGYNGTHLNSGGRYNPSTDTWTPTSTGSGVPAVREGATAVWTGTEMIVWGGSNGSVLNTGGRYQPATDTWVATSTGANVPTSRSDHAAVWTGTEMIVWGGYDGSYLNSGGRYDPGSDTWVATSTGANVPTARRGHTAVWSPGSSVLIVWGGEDASFVPVNTGGRYSPGTNTWTATSTGTNCPPAVSEHSAVWTGTEMIVWGGTRDFLFDTNGGGRYNPSSNGWTALSATNAPSARQGHTAVWTGSVMIVWGGTSSLDGSVFNTGGRYTASSTTWTATSTGTSVPSGRYGHTAVWSGSEMIVWGGFDASVPSLPTETGGRYNPSGNSWVATSTGGNVPEARYLHTAVWTGTEMIVWGGNGGLRGRLASGGRYDLATDSWTRTSTGTSVPAARDEHTAVWTGTEMVVWGGFGGSYLNSGGRYRALDNTWRTTSTGANVPAARRRHTAVWTGTTMIVWGGTAAAVFNSGGRYDPVGDSWTPTSIGAFVPEARFSHTAVWTGSTMIVWGGSNGSAYINTGGLYTPGDDSWTATSIGTNVPGARALHAAVWNGTRMIVWGGYAPPYLNTGGRYDLAGAGSWTSTSTLAGVPSSRSSHVALWIADKMIVWGGYDGNPLGNGGRYRPLDDRWFSLSDIQAPPARRYFSAVDTGQGDGRMIVWGGSPITATGGVYCAACTLRTWYRDTDSDGHGNPATSASSCEQPTGYSASGDDCNDSDAAVWHVPAEVSGLRVTKPTPGVAGLSWDSQASGAGPATVYDLVTGTLGDLRASRTFSGATCLASRLATTSYNDERSGPPPNTGWYYLGRAQNGCGRGTYGDARMSPDPRDTLDTSGPCP